VAGPVAAAGPAVAAAQGFGAAPPNGDGAAGNGAGGTATIDAPPPDVLGPPPGGDGGGEWEEEPAEERSTTWRYVVLLVLLLIALGIVVALLGRQLGLLDASTGKETVAPPPPTTPISMPADLIGKTYTDAANELEGLGLRWTRVDVQDTQHAQNTIINTSPAAGRQVSGTTVVTLDVSSGPAPITEPDVVGVDLAAATAQLQAAGFTVAAPTSAVSPYVAPGQVASTDPPPGTLAHKGDTVKIVVSAPRTAVALPDVSGDSQLQAAGVLVRDGFQVVVASRQNSPTVPKGDVIATQPAAGTKTMQGGVVGFIVSLGPAPAA
jgi:serine/threonine-protein kinase